MTEHLYERFGGSTYPIDPSQIDDTALSFEPLDPALEVLVSLISTAVRAEAQSGSAEAWAKVCASLPSAHELSGSTDPIGSTIKWEPDEQNLRQVKRGSWPMLAVYADDEITYPRDGELYYRRRKFYIYWILGPGKAGENKKLDAILPWFSGLTQRVIARGYHPNYLSGANVLATARVSEWKTGDEETKHEKGKLDFDSGTYLAMRCPIVVVEKLADIGLGGGIECTGAYITIGAGGEEEILPAMITADSQLPPQDD